MTPIKNKEILSVMILALLLLVPIFSFAQGLIPDCSSKGGECGFEEFMALINNIVGWIVIVAAPVSAGVFVWAGFLYMTSGVVDQKAKAKDMMWKVFWGFIAILSAWLIVSTIVNTLVTNTEVKNSIPAEVQIK